MADNTRLSGDYIKLFRNLLPYAGELAAARAYLLRLGDIMHLLYPGKLFRQRPAAPFLSLM